MPELREEDSKRNNAFSLYDLFDHVLAQETLPWRHEIYIFSRHYLGNHYFTINLFELCLGVEKKSSIEIMHFHNITYMATPKHKNANPRSHEIYTFGKHLLGRHNYKLSLSVLCLGREENF